MKKSLLGSVLAIVVLVGLGASPLSAQATTVIAVKPCALTYATPVAANTPVGVHAHGYCGIPEDATALFLHVKIGDEIPPGKLWFWTNSDVPNGTTLEHNSQCNYQDAAPPNPVSCHVLVRIDDGYYNFWVESSAAINLSVVVEGYVAPLTEPPPSP